MQINHSVLESPGKAVAQDGRWELREMTLTVEKVCELWQLFQNYKTLFSDVTRGDYENWVTYVTDPYTYWLELYEEGKIVGIIHCEDMQQVYDTQAHIIIFDRAPTSKADGCKLAMHFLFEKFPLERITVMVPSLYFASARLALKLGFMKEGLKRKAISIGGKFWDMIIFGILRSEVLDGTHGQNQVS